MLPRCTTRAPLSCVTLDETRMRARPMPKPPNLLQRSAGVTRTHPRQINVADLWNFQEAPVVWPNSQKDIPMNHATSRGTAPRLATPTDLGANAAKDIAGALNGILADSF